jgi:hypothetical protein
MPIDYALLSRQSEREFVLFVYIHPDNGRAIMSEVAVTQTELNDHYSYPPVSKLKYSRKTSKRIMDRRNYLVGIGLLLCVVFLWTFSSFLTQVTLISPG